MKNGGHSLKKRLRTLVVICLLPLAVMAVVLILQMNNFAVRYNHIVGKITQISDYNIDFKEDMDYAMYIIVVNADRAAELIEEDEPHEMIEDARQAFAGLYEDESSEYGKIYLWRIISCLDILEERVTEIEEDALVSGNYDLNMERLELNIYVLTDLIQEQIQDYIYYETSVLSELSSEVRHDMVNVMSLSVMLIILITGVAFFISRKLMRGITEPIRELCEGMKQVGSGGFDVSVSEQSDDEMVTLNHGFNQMVRQIGQLVDDIREEQTNLRVTEIGLLQAQIHPHFLYNTLDAITWLAESGENKKVVMMVDNLSTFFRVSLSKGREFITIEEEIKHTRSYLEIQKVRYGDILNYEIDIPKEAEAYIVPKLTLQPIVENSIYHGLKNKRGGGIVRVTGRICRMLGGEAEAETNENESDPQIQSTVTDIIELTVEDNGIGMSEENLCSLRDSVSQPRETKGETSGGFGMYNVNQRIRLYYGEEYGVSIESVFGEGTSVKIVLPALYCTDGQ